MLSVGTEAVLTDKGGQRLGLEEVLRGLVLDGIVHGEQAQTLISTRRKLGNKTDDDEHPLALIASRQWSSADTPSHILTEERLMRWLAGRAKLAYYRIDPLKIDTTAVTSLISYPYAARYHILPVAVDDEKILVATAQPFSPNAVGMVDSRNSISCPEGERVFNLPSWGRRRSTKSIRPITFMRLVTAAITTGGISFTR